MSYADISFADDHFSERYGADEWDQTSESNKQKLLSTSTMIIDQLNFAGCKADDDQENEFPRGTDTEVPVQIKKACCEIALALLNGGEPDYDYDKLFDTSASLDIGRLSTSPKDIHIMKIHGIPSILAWGFLRPFLRDGSVITFSRVD
jgi:hypothetical protein